MGNLHIHVSKQMGVKQNRCTYEYTASNIRISVIFEDKVNGGLKWLYSRAEIN